MIHRLLRVLLQPPPLVWRWERGGPQLLWFGPPTPFAYGLAVLQQLSWMLLRPLIWRQRPQQRLPRRLALLACWLNSYRPAEVRQWLALGLHDWAQISLKRSDRQAAAIHRQRRRPWPQQCRPALRVLADKALLLDLIPQHWQPPWLQLPADPSGANDASSEAIPAWWQGALLGPGIVVKPRRGHGGRAVIQFRWTNAHLEQRPLFRPLPAPSPAYGGPPCPGPAALARHWQQWVQDSEEAIAMPYLHQAPSLPDSQPATVLRVITQQAWPGSPVTIQQAWLEVPLPPEPQAVQTSPMQGKTSGPVVFLSMDGQVLPLAGRALTPTQANCLEPWQTLLAAEGGPPSPLLACLNASITLHQQLPPIDQVAWDWIPAQQEPLLLEGNGGFGILVPQLLTEQAVQGQVRS